MIRIVFRTFSIGKENRKTGNTVPIQISTWNIHGFKSKIVNNKLTDSTFLKEIENDDIVCLVETHSNDVDDQLSIPGLKRVKVKNRPSNSTKSSGGGLACFAREKISNSIIPINNNNADTLWIKLKKDIFDKKQDIYIGTVYLKPYKNNADNSKKILELFEEIFSFQEKGEVIVQGDFNARTNVDDDTITIDKFDDDFMIPTENVPQNIHSRNSEDKVTADHRGKELLELCKSLGLLILNGRKVGDLFGKYTSIQWNGCSVVDYVLASNSIYSSISYFKVGNFIPWLSDHCALRFSLDSCVEYEKAEEKKPGTKFEKLFWGEDSPEKFTSILRTHEQEIEMILNSPETHGKEIVDKFQNLMKNVVQEGNFKKKSKKPSDDAPWFDEECRKSRAEISSIGKSLQNYPNDLEIRKSLNERKRIFRKLTRDKKRSYEKNIFDNMMNFNSQNESKKFWNSLRKLNKEQEMDYVSCISEQSWTEHFKKIRRTDVEPTYPPDFVDPGPLDYLISLEELKDVEGVLKNGKASGIDLISYEMLKCIIAYNPNILLKVFNSVLQHNLSISDWFVSIITPIHKKGPKMDPDNYRGISLISCLYKLLTAILNKRLEKYCKENKILPENALGFVSGNRTSDAHLILHYLTQNYCHKSNRYIYSCFVDFSKAFDCIPRDILFQRLIDKGITGKVFNLIKNIYMHEKCQIKMGGMLSDPFDANQGVRQGCILSPILFNIFISDLPNILNNPENEPVKFSLTKTLSCILWADDLVMFSETKEGLTKMIGRLSTFASENGLTINVDKTKCMVFNKSGRHIRCTIPYGNTIINSTREYKYLGFLVTPSGEVNTGIRDLKARALYALVQLRKKMGIHFRENIVMSLYLFDTLIKPIILYCSDFWGFLRILKKSPSELLRKDSIIELVQMKFLKQLLGVQTQTSNIGVLLEVGRVPLMAFALKNSIKNWNRIANLKKCNSLTDISLFHIKEFELEWHENLKLFLDNIGLTRILNGNNNDPGKTVFQRCIDIFHQNSLAQITNENSKLRTYGIFKSEIREEPYLRIVKNVKDRISMTKFRLSNHNLMIEKGRHRNLDRTMRICLFCTAVEDEIHFLTKCETFRHLRSSLLHNVEQKLNIRNLKYMEGRSLLKLLLEKEEIAQLVAKYLTKSFELREFLAANPRQFM